MLLLSIFLSVAKSTQSIPCQSRNVSTVSDSFSIYECLFNSFASSTNGGSISISAASSNLTISTSAFMCSSTTSTQGGAVYFSGYCIIINQTCASDCLCTGTNFADGGHFCHTMGSISSIYQLSTLRCSNTTSSPGRYSFFIGNGTQNSQLVNSSSNSVEYGGGFMLYYPTTSTATLFNIFNCTSTGGSIVLYFEYCASAFISHSNIVGNIPSSLTVYGVVFHSSAYTTHMVTINGSIFASNKGDCLFFRNAQAGITVENCWIDSSISSIYSSCSAAITTNCNITLTSSFHFQSCGINAGGSQCVIMREDKQHSGSFTLLVRLYTPSIFILYFALIGVHI